MNAGDKGLVMVQRSGHNSAWGNTIQQQIVRQLISSHSTLVYKLLVPVVSVALSVFLVVSLFYYPSPFTMDATVATILIIGVTVFFCWFGVRLKQVRIDEHYLYNRGLL